nr:hypothetical protein [Deinococcus planocerae]
MIDLVVQSTCPVRPPMLDDANERAHLKDQSRLLVQFPGEAGPEAFRRFDVASRQERVGVPPRPREKHVPLVFDDGAGEQV